MNGKMEVELIYALHNILKYDVFYAINILFCTDIEGIYEQQ